MKDPRLVLVVRVLRDRPATRPRGEQLGNVPGKLPAELAEQRASNAPALTASCQGRANG